MTTRRENMIIRFDGEEVKKRAEKLAKMSSFEVGLVVESYAKNLAPVKSGRLRSSITTVSYGNQRTKPSGKGAVSTDYIAKPDEPGETFVGTPVDYGPYVEYGTIKSNAQPFLRPALDMAKGRVPKIVQVGAKKEFGEYLTTKQIFSQTNEAFSE